MHPRALLAPALLAFSAALAADPVPLQNPGFEDGYRGWSPELVKRFEGLITIERQSSHSGNVSLKIAARTGAEYPYLAQGVTDLRGGAVYALRAWVKSQGEDRPPIAALKIEFYSAAGANTSGHYARLPIPPGEWRALEVRARAPADTTRASLLVRLFGKGTVWFDDVEFEAVQPPPPLVLAPERQVARAGASRELSLAVRLARPWEQDGDPPLQVELLGPDGKPVPATPQVTRLDPHSLTLAVSMPQLREGTHQVRCRMPGVEQPGTAFVFVPLDSRKPRNLSDTGVILADGEPFFPIGLYHVGVADYEEIARRGFNCVQGLATHDITSLSSALDAALNNRLMMDVPLYGGGLAAGNLPASRQKIERLGKHLAVLNWKIMDEPDIRPEVMDEIPGVYQTLKGLNPDQPLLLTVATPDQYEYWAHFCDILQVDPYPLPNQPLTVVADYVSRAKKALQPWQNLTAVLQAGYVKEPLNQPSFAQARVMVYLALISGAKGLFWYSYRDPGWRLDETPLWPRFDEINRETQALSRPVMLGAEPAGVKVDADAPGLLWTARDFEDKTYVLLANPTPDPLRVTIDPGREIGGAPALQGKPAELRDGKAFVELPPTGAETILLAPPAKTG